MTKGKIYKIEKFEGMETARFPFDCPYGIFVETVKSGFLRFVWDGKDMLINGGNYQEVNFEVKQ